MKLHIFTLILFILLSDYMLSANTDAIFENFDKQNFSEAYQLSKEIIEKKTEDPLARYGQILSASGLYLRREFSEEQIQELNKNLSGKNIQLRPLPVTSGDCKIDCIRYMNQDPAELYIITTTLDNKGKDAIILMVYITLKYNMHENAFNSLNKENMIIKGNIEKIELRGNLYKRFNLHINNAEMIPV